MSTFNDVDTGVYSSCTSGLTEALVWTSSRYKVEF